MGTVSTILSPLDYVRIRHPIKRVVSWWSFIMPSLASGLAVWFLPTANLFGSSGLIIGLNSLVQILTGFFITSLAAIATFNGSVYRIDDVFEGEAALLDGEPLTRRQFLCHLFAYVALLSLSLYLIGVLGITAASTLHGAVPTLDARLLRTGFIGLYLALFGNVVGTTMIGLIFLSSRLTRVSRRDRVTATPRVPPKRESLASAEDPRPPAI